MVSSTTSSSYTYMLPSEDYQELTDMAVSVAEVEKLMRYPFKNKKLLEDALTHPSYTGSASYQRLEFVGDAALGLAISSYVFMNYPDLEPGKLSLIRAANVSTENLARVAVRHHLYKYVRHNAATLGDKVREFVLAVHREDNAEIYGGLVKAPKVLADVVEAVVAAVYVDCNYDLKATWLVIRNLLEPIVMLDALEQQPQPVTMLFELCQKDGKRVDIKHWRNGQKNIASIYVDGEFVASASSDQKENAKLNAAKAVLEKLSYDMGDMKKNDLFSQLNGDDEIVGAKQKLNELCGKKKWPKPNYKIVKEIGREHEKSYVSSVEIEITEGLLFVVGIEKSRVKDADNSAASSMLLGLQQSKYL